MMLGEVPLIARVDPGFERDLEHGNPSLRREARRRLLDAAPAQLLGDGGCEGCELDQLSLAKLGIRGDDRIALRA